MVYWQFYTNKGIFLSGGIKAITAKIAVEKLREEQKQKDEYFDRYYEIDEVIKESNKIIFK
jgi:hypothetical protein